MHVASLELCKTLHELSGWTDAHSVWYWYEDYDCIDDSEYKATCHQTMQDKKTECPAYDLGYLLRKLPDAVTLTKYDGKLYLAVCGPDTLQEANTPEDAAAKLCIELIKQGILQKDGDE